MIKGIAVYVVTACLLAAWGRVLVHAWDAPNPAFYIAATATLCFAFGLGYWLSDANEREEFRVLARSVASLFGRR